MKKLEYFYGDSIPDSSKGFDGKYKWIRVVDGRNMFLLDMDRMYPLIYMQPLSITRSMPWDLTGTVSGVITSHIVNRSARPAGPQVISGLQPGLYRPEFPMGETPASVGAFIHQFKMAGGNYPASDFRTLGWIHFQEKGWWHRLTGHVIDNLGRLLVKARLLTAVRAVKYGIPLSVSHFFALLEMYNS